MPQSCGQPRPWRLLFGVAPSLFLAARGSNVQRLIGLQLLTACSVMVLIGLSIIVGQSSYLIVPFVLAVLASIGTLVYTRLLKPGIDGQQVLEEE
jgi:multisubunit Na+/H+ antiporter MnhF subunit